MRIIIFLWGLLIFSCKNETKLTVLKETFKTEVEFEKKQMSSKILFARTKGNDTGWSIYSIDPNGQNEALVIPFKSGQGEYNPRIAPNGSDILFNTYRYGGWKLARFNVSTKKVYRVSESSSYYFNGVYSYNGDQIAYEKVGRGEKAKICFANNNGSNEIMITNKMPNAENRAPFWTPDDASILFYSDANISNDIYKYNIENQSIIDLTNNSEGNDFNPSVSPDGKNVAFYSDRDGHLDVFVMDINGQNIKCLTQDIRSENNGYNYYKDTNLYWVFKIDWSPDGKYLVFSNIKSDNIDLFTIKIDGSELKQLTKTKASEFTPTWGQLLN